VLDKVQSYAPDDWDFVLCHGTEERFHRDLFLCDFSRWVEDVVVLHVDNVRFESGLLGRCAYVKVR
jgi:hypothetical protein